MQRMGIAIAAFVLVWFASTQPASAWGGRWAVCNGCWTACCSNTCWTSCGGWYACSCRPCWTSCCVSNSRTIAGARAALVAPAAHRLHVVNRQTGRRRTAPHSAPPPAQPAASAKIAFRRSRSRPCGSATVRGPTRVVRQYRCRYGQRGQPLAMERGGAITGGGCAVARRNPVSRKSRFNLRTRH